ncbi:MAG: phosphoenolpyruvate--protein phosphotransferase [Spirochaetaceae bacterium]
MKQLQGIAASKGIAIGPAFLYRVELPELPVRLDVDPAEELERFEQSVTAVREHLDAIEERKRGQMHADNFEILEVQKVLLSDEEYGDRIRDRIQNKSLNAEAAVQEVTETVVADFSALEDEYFSQRAADVADLGSRLLRNLLGVPDVDLSGLEEPVILLAHDLSPSDTIGFELDKIIALCTEVGSSTSHTAIVARSMGIPAIVGVGPMDVDEGTTVILDGNEGVCLADPDEQTLGKYRKRKRQEDKRREQLLNMAEQPAVTTDGVHIHCVANVSGPESARAAAEHGADGVGLLRSEFLFLERSTLPDENEQYAAYMQIAEFLPDTTIVVRTLDVGGDKSVPAIKLPKEENPFLGHRAIRLTLERDNLFTPQIRALLRTAAARDVRIMIPFVSTLTELREARTRIMAIQADMKAAGDPVCENPKIGIMVEIPSAAIMADAFAAEADFFSIGTNDLCQYTMAVDRTNAKVADLADFLDPAVLHLIKRSIDAAERAGIPVAMCGEMAGSVIAVPLLLGMGLREFSMSSSQLPEVKDLIRRLSADECRPLVDTCMRAETAQDVRSVLQDFLDSRLSRS